MEPNNTEPKQKWYKKLKLDWQCLAIIAVSVVIFCIIFDSSFNRKKTICSTKPRLDDSKGLIRSNLAIANHCIDGELYVSYGLLGNNGEMERYIILTMTRQNIKCDCGENPLMLR